MLAARRLPLLLLGVGLAATGLSQVRGIDLLISYARALSDAKSLKASYTVTPVGGVGTEYALEAKRPGLVRAENATTLVIADGKEVFTYDKRSKIFYRRAQSEATMREALQVAGAEVFEPFFDGKTYSRVVDPRATGSYRRKGMVLEGVRFSPINEPNKRLLTLYMPRTDYIVRQAEVVEGGDVPRSSVLDTRTVALDDEIGDDRFTWSTPSGSLELPYELATGRAWFTDVELAKDVAKRTGEVLLLHFFAGSCRGCKAMRERVFLTPEVMRAGTPFVLCEIDIEQKPQLAKEYSAIGHPIYKFYRSEGSFLHEERDERSIREAQAMFRRVLEMAR